jgi:plastocyanin
LTHDDIKYKVIYTTSLTGFTSTSTTTEAETQEESDIVVHILRGSSTQGIAADYIEAGEIRQEYITERGSSGLRLNYFAPERVSIEPGTSITFVNGDDVAHRVVSGTGLDSSNRVHEGMIICETPAEKLPEGFSHVPTSCSFTFDGRINSGTIEPGESWIGSFDEAGFYRIIDPDYPWMSIVVYSFPESDSEVIRRVGANQVGN